MYIYLSRHITCPSYLREYRKRYKFATLPAHAFL